MLPRHPHLSSGFASVSLSFLCSTRWHYCRAGSVYRAIVRAAMSRRKMYNTLHQCNGTVLFVSSCAVITRSRARVVCSGSVAGTRRASFAVNARSWEGMMSFTDWNVGRVIRIIEAVDDRIFYRILNHWYHFKMYHVIYSERHIRLKAYTRRFNKCFSRW